MPNRWDGDERGHGVTDAAALVSGASELLTAFRQQAWVAEEPEAHLLPHVQAWCERDQRLALTRAASDQSGAYVLDLEWQGPEGHPREVRAAAFSLIGRIAESATYVRQRRLGAGSDGKVTLLRFEVGTGELAADTSFAPHGHVLVLNIAVTACGALLR